MLLCFVPQGQLSYEQLRAARIRNQTSIYTKAARGLRRLSDGHVTHGELTARQWALSTKDGNKLKIMRMLSIHHFILRHHLSFVVFFLYFIHRVKLKEHSLFSVWLQFCVTAVLGSISLWSRQSDKYTVILSCPSAGVIVKNIKGCNTTWQNHVAAFVVCTKIFQRLAIWWIFPV